MRQSKSRVQFDGFLQCGNGLHGAFLPRQSASFSERREGVEGRRGSPIQRQTEVLQRRWLFAELPTKIGSGHAECAQCLAFVRGIALRDGYTLVPRAPRSIQPQRISAPIFSNVSGEVHRRTEERAKLGSNFSCNACANRAAQGPQ